MAVLLLLLLAILMTGLLGGALYVLIEKIKRVKRQNQELEAYRAKEAAAD